ncbi:MAG: FkbM family methyltransferase [Alphaproteobacteria bacterium]
MGIWPGSRGKAFRKSTEGKLAGLLARHRIGCVIDVGANTGQTGQMLRRIGFAGRIVSFEPGPAAHAALSAAAAGDAGWTVAPRTAVGAERGTITLTLSEASDRSSALPPPTRDARPAPHTRHRHRRRAGDHGHAIVADHCRAGERLLLKIDTQGMEMAVLAGAEPVLDRIDAIHVEMSLLPLYEGEPDYLAILQHLHARGFRPAMLTERTFSEALGRQLQVDGLFFRDA